MLFTKEAHWSLGAQGFWEAGHVGSLCQVRTKIPNTLKESRCSVQSKLFGQCRHFVSQFSYQGIRGTFPNSKFRHQPKATLAKQGFLRKQDNSFLCKHVPVKSIGLNYILQSGNLKYNVVTWDYKLPINHRVQKN